MRAMLVVSGRVLLGMEGLDEWDGEMNNEDFARPPAEKSLDPIQTAGSGRILNRRELGSKLQCFLPENWIR